MKNLYKIEDELYIVSSSEKIKENTQSFKQGLNGDWFYNTIYNFIARTGDITPYDFKIILTTNKSLINEGVQFIDDDFLEWFVKNPSCEEVEVEEINNKWHKEDGNVVSVSVYKIILPKEKLGGIPKGTINMVIGKPKQKTLEEASLLSRPIHLIWDEGERYDCNEKFREEFKKGAYWNQEKSYSEEEVLDILVKAIKDVKVKQLTFYDGGSEYPIYSNLSKWFEQFKKK